MANENKLDVTITAEVKNSAGSSLSKKTMGDTNQNFGSGGQARYELSAAASGLEFPLHGAAAVGAIALHAAGVNVGSTSGINSGVCLQLQGSGPIIKIRPNGVFCATMDGDLTQILISNRNLSTGVFVDYTVSDNANA